MIFIDTNVLIGYCFEIHSDNGQCRILDNKSNLWLSDKVLVEWRRKEKTILNDYENKIRRHIQDIRRRIPDTVEINHRDTLIRMTDKELRNFFQRWYQEDVIYPISRDQLCDQIETILLEMQFDKRQRLSKIISLCSQHTRTNRYPIEESNLKPCVHNGDGDRAIILDAHDLSIDPVLNKLGSQLQFWTFDGGISRDCKNKILSDTNIADVKDVKYDYLSLI